MSDGTLVEAGGLRLPPGFRVIGFPTVGSTNDEAKRFAREGAAEGTVVWALRQETGRGRRGRAWSSPEGNLYTSTILRPRRTPAEAAQLSFVAALAVADMAERLLPAGSGVGCKWPNDVLVRGRKLSGILLESEPGPDGGVDWLVLGVGVNVRHHPELADYAATSLGTEGAGEVEVTAALEVYVACLARWYGLWARGGFPAIREAWLKRAIGLGGPVTVRLAHETLVGIFADLDMDGVLLLDREDGTGRRRIAAGDVFFGGAPARSAEG